MSQRRVCRFGLLLLSALVASAQLYTGSVAGIVRDPAGAPVPKAKVILTDIDRGTRNETATDDSGRYLLRSLRPGKYAVEVAAVGFEPLKQEDLVVEVNGAISGDPTLRVSEHHESVLVEAAYGAPRPANSIIATILDRGTINGLPLQSRSPFDLAFLAPGVSQSPGTAYGQGVGTPASSQTSSRMEAAMPRQTFYWTASA